MYISIYIYIDMCIYIYMYISIYISICGRALRRTHASGLGIRSARVRAGYGLRGTVAQDIRCFGFRVLLFLHLRLCFGVRRLWILPGIYVVLDLELYCFYNSDFDSARAGDRFGDTLAWDMRCLGFRVILLPYLRLSLGARTR